MNGVNEKKTDRILNHFESHPNKVFTPAQVGDALGYHPKLVASVVGRLVAKGDIKKVGRGKFKYVFSVAVDDNRIIGEARNIIKDSFGEGIIDRLGLNKEYGDLASLLAALKQNFGNRLADNVVKQAILKVYKGKKAEAIINRLGL